MVLKLYAGAAEQGEKKGPHHATPVGFSLSTSAGVGRVDRPSNPNAIFRMAPIGGLQAPTAPVISGVRGDTVAQLWLALSCRFRLSRCSSVSSGKLRFKGSLYGLGFKAF